MNSSDCERVKAIRFVNAGPAVIPHTGCGGGAMDEDRKGGRYGKVFKQQDSF